MAARHGSVAAGLRQPAGLLWRRGNSRRLVIRRRTTLLAQQPLSPTVGELTLKERVLAVVKPPLYAVAWVPVTVGFACAFCESGALAAERWACLTAASCLVIAWLNLSNDAWDSETGVDQHKWESAVALLGSRRHVHALAWPLLALALALLSSVAPRDTLVLLTCAVACGHAYQAPPFRLSYRGLGEPLCFLAFGPLATSAFRLAAFSPSPPSIHSALSPLPLACCLLVGATTTVILFCSHMHQVEGDIAAGKQSPVAQLGLERSALLLRLPLVAIHAAATALSALRCLPLPAGILTLAAVPRALSLDHFVREMRHDENRIGRAKFFAVKWHAAYGASLALGIALPRLVESSFNCLV